MPKTVKYVSGIKRKPCIESYKALISNDGGFVFWGYYLLEVLYQ